MNKLVAILLTLASCGCTASEADCEAFGRHFVELSIVEAEAREVTPGAIEGVAEDLAKQLVRDCKAEPRRKSELDCLLQAATLAELETCS